MASDAAQDPARPMGFAGLRDLPAPPLPEIAEPPAPESGAAAPPRAAPAGAAQVNPKADRTRGILIALAVAAALFTGAYFVFRDTGAEVLPPVAQGATLDAGQIRYCVSEDIRLEAARRVIPSAGKDAAQRFNAMVSDYNGRCASFRYRSGVLQSMRSEAEARRRQLEAEGAARFGQ